AADRIAVEVDGDLPEDVLDDDLKARHVRRGGASVIDLKRSIRKAVYRGEVLEHLDDELREREGLRLQLDEDNRGVAGRPGQGEVLAPQLVARCAHGNEIFAGAVRRRVVIDALRPAGAGWQCSAIRAQDGRMALVTGRDDMAMARHGIDTRMHH